MKKNTEGYVALIVVLTLSVVLLAITASVTLLSIGEAQSSFAVFKGEEALQTSEGCMEDALLKAKDSASYAGGSITRPEGTCSISISKNGTLWTLTATTTDVIYKRTIQTVINRVANVTILRWIEL